MNPKKKLKLYAWLFKYFRNKYREAYMTVYKVDNKCRNCNVWFSISMLDGKPMHFEDTDFGYSMKCGNCGNMTYWNCEIAPFPVSCDETGMPYNCN